MRLIFFVILCVTWNWAIAQGDVCVVYADNPAENISFQTINGPVIINPQGAVEVNPTSYVYPVEQVVALVDSMLEVRYDARLEEDRNQIESLKKQVNDLIFSQRTMESQLSSAMAQIERIKQDLATNPTPQNKAALDALISKAESVIISTQGCLNEQIPIQEEEISPNRYRFRIELDDLKNLPGLIVQFEPYEGMVRVKRNNRYGYYDQNGDLAIPFKYESASDFREGQAFVSRNGSFHLIDRTEKIVRKLDFEDAISAIPIYPGFVLTQNNNGHYRLYTYDDKQVFQSSFERYRIHNKIIVLQNFSTAVFYDLAKRKIIKTVSSYEPIHGTDVGAFRDGSYDKACYQCKGLITNLGEVIFPPKYEFISSYKDNRNLFRFRRDRSNGLLHRTKGELFSYNLGLRKLFHLEPWETVQFIYEKSTSNIQPKPPIFGQSGSLTPIGLLTSDYQVPIPVQEYSELGYDPALEKIHFQTRYEHSFGIREGLLHLDGTPFLDSINRIKAIPVGESVYYAAHKNKAGTWDHTSDLVLYSPTGHQLTSQSYLDISYDDYFEGFFLDKGSKNWLIIDTGGDTILASNSSYELTDQRLNEDIFLINDPLYHRRKGLGHRRLGIIHEPQYSDISATTLDTIFVADKACNMTLNPNCKYLLTSSGRLVSDQAFAQISAIQPNDNFIVQKGSGEQTTASLLTLAGELIGDYHAIHPCDENLLHVVESYHSVYHQEVNYGLINGTGLEIIPPVLTELKTSGNRYRGKIVGGERYLFDQNGRVLKGDAARLSELVKNYYGRR